MKRENHLRQFHCRRSRWEQAQKSASSLSASVEIIAQTSSPALLLLLFALDAVCRFSITTAPNSRLCSEKEREMRSRHQIRVRGARRRPPERNTRIDTPGQIKQAHIYTARLWKSPVWNHDGDARGAFSFSINFPAVIQSHHQRAAILDFHTVAGVEQKVTLMLVDFC